MAGENNETSRVKEIQRRILAHGTQESPMGKEINYKFIGN